MKFEQLIERRVEHSMIQDTASSMVGHNLICGSLNCGGHKKSGNSKRFMIVQWAKINSKPTCSDYKMFLAVPTHVVFYNFTADLVLIMQPEHLVLVHAFMLHNTNTLAKI